MPDGALKIVNPGGLFLQTLLMEGVVLRLGVEHSQFVGYFSRMGEDVAVVEAEEAVEFGDPVAHVHGDAAQGLALGKD